MRARAVIAVWLLGVVGVVTADDRPLDRAEQDRRTARVVYETALLGSELYNKGNFEGCFRLYQGTLLAVQPMLDHRPKLAALVKDRLEKAAPMRATVGAFVLREALTAIQTETADALVPAKKGEEPTPAKKGPPLWDRLGGEKTVRLVVKDCMTAVAADPKVNITRGGKYKLDDTGLTKLEQSLVEMVSQATGGPLRYTGKDMASAHAGMKITDAEFNAMAIHLLSAMQKHRIPQNETLELIEIVGATRKDVVGK